MGDSAKSCHPCPEGSFCTGGSGWQSTFAPIIQTIQAPKQGIYNMYAFLHPPRLPNRSWLFRDAAVSKCPTNSHSSANGTSCMCNDGFYGSSLQPDKLMCNPCPPNSFCAGNLVTNCTTNSYTLSGATNCFYMHRTILKDCARRAVLNTKLCYPSLN